MNAPFEVVRADSGLEAIIWIALAIVWAVAQAISKSREKKFTRQNRPPPKPRGTLQADLDKFFEELSQQQKQKPAQRPPQPAHAPSASAALAPQPPALPHEARRPAAKVRHPRRPMPTHVPVPEIQPIRPMHEAPALSEPSELTAGTGDYALRGAMKRSMPRSLLLGAKGFQMSFMRLGPPSSKRPSREVAHMFSDSRAIKRSVIAQVVLGTPRGLEKPGFGAHRHGT